VSLPVYPTSSPSTCTVTAAVDGRAAVGTVKGLYSEYSVPVQYQYLTAEQLSSSRVFSDRLRLFGSFSRSGNLNFTSTFIILLSCWTFTLLFTFEVAKEKETNMMRSILSVSNAGRRSLTSRSFAAMPKPGDLPPAGCPTPSWATMNPEKLSATHPHTCFNHVNGKWTLSKR
jgi:hypothetical protein